MDARWSRLWFATTTVCVIAGVALSIYTAVHHPGHFRTGVERAFNVFAFFTVQSNLILGATSLLLAMNPDRSSSVFAVFRLTGMVQISVTGIVFHVALARLLELEGWDQLGNQLVHTIVPLLAVIGWVAFGPRGLTSKRIAAWSVLIPVAYLTFTLIRGAFVHWYPYPFLDVTRLGYGGTLLNCVWLALVLLAIASGITALDRVLGRFAGPPAGPGALLRWRKLARDGACPGSPAIRSPGPARKRRRRRE